MFGAGKVMKELQKLLEEKNKVYVIDVRTKEEYDAGHIQGAVNIPLDKIESQFSKKFPNEKEEYYFYCHSGARSAMVVNYLKTMGYLGCRNAGSIMRWKGKIEKQKLLFTAYAK